MVLNHLESSRPLAAHPHQVEAYGGYDLYRPHRHPTFLGSHRGNRAYPVLLYAFAFPNRLVYRFSR